MKKRVLLTVHVDLHQEMRVAAARRRLTLGALYEMAARLLLAEADDPTRARRPAQGGAR
jgi:hypothetical protein